MHTQKAGFMYLQDLLILVLALFPGSRCVWLHEERRGPGIFSHVCDV